MQLESIFRSISERVDMESVLLLVMLVSASYMIWESFNFGISQAAIFPRLTAGFVVIGTILLLLRPILPEPIYSFVAKDARALDVDDDFKELTSSDSKEDVNAEGGLDPEEDTENAVDLKTEKEDESGEALETDSTTVSNRPLPDAVFTGAAAICYGLAGYAVGLFLVTPLFVAVYGLWFRLPRRTIALLVILSLIIAFGFVQFLNVPLDQGELIFPGGWL